MNFSKKTAAVIQAGGMGSRMKELTRDEIPKPMLLINGKPMLQWQIEAVKRYGIKDIVIITGHLGHTIRSYFSDGAEYGVNISYIDEDKPLGSGGALFFLKEYPADYYLIIYGDIMFDIDLHRFIGFHDANRADITFAAHPNSHPLDSDILVAGNDGRVTEILYKNKHREGWTGNFVNAGLQIFSSNIIDAITAPKRLDLEKDIAEKRLRNGRVFAYRTSEYIKDAGTPERFRKVSEDQKSGKWEKRNLKNEQKCIFLDRDGTLNRLDGLIGTPDKLVLENQAAEAIKLINSSDYIAILVTNQPVVARGICTEDDVKEIHRKLETLLGEKEAYIDDMIFCPHHPDKGYPGENVAYKIDCECRKPKTGMIDVMAERYNIDLSNSYFVGDTTVDIQTGINAGLKTVLLHTGEAGKDGKFKVKPDMEADDLLAAVKLIMKEEG